MATTPESEPRPAPGSCCGGDQQPRPPPRPPEAHLPFHSSVHSPGGELCAAQATFKRAGALCPQPHLSKWLFGPSAPGLLLGLLHQPHCSPMQAVLTPPTQGPSGDHRHLSPGSATPKWTPVPTLRGHHCCRSRQVLALPARPPHTVPHPLHTVPLTWLITLSFLATTLAPDLLYPRVSYPALPGIPTPTGDTESASFSSPIVSVEGQGRARGRKLGVQRLAYLSHPAGHTPGIVSGGLRGY